MSGLYFVPESTGNLYLFQIKNRLIPGPAQRQSRGFGSALSYRGLRFPTFSSAERFARLAMTPEGIPGVCPRIDGLVLPSLDLMGIGLPDIPYRK